MRRFFVSLLAFAALAGPAAAATNFVGTTVTVSLDYPDKGTLYVDSPLPPGDPITTTAITDGEQVVASGAMYSRPWTFDVHANSIVFHPNEGGFSYGAAGTFNGWDFDFAGLTTHITNVTVDPSTTFDPVSVSWTNNQVFLNYLGATPTTDSVAQFDVTFGAGVPEAATWAMMLLGLFGLGAVLRSSRRNGAVAV